MHSVGVATRSERNEEARQNGPMLAQASRLIILLPVVNALADVTTNYMQSFVVNSGMIRAALLAATILYVLTFHVRFSKSFVAIAVFLAYLAIRASASSSLSTSYSEFAKVALSLPMFYVGTVLVRTSRDERALTISMIVATTIVLAQLAVAQIIGYGKTLYTEDSFFLGGGVGASLYYLGLVLVAPLAFAHAKKRSSTAIIAALSIASIAVTVVALKRATLAGVVLGFLVYGLFAPRRTRLIRYGMVLGVAVLLLAPKIATILDARLADRAKVFQTIENQGRYRETVIVWNELMTKSSSHAFFGTELFNFSKYYGVKRQLHVDFNALLHGAGVVGVGLYLLVFLAIVIEFRHAVRTARSRLPAFYWKELRAIFAAVATYGVVISFAYSLTALGFRATMLLYLGGIVGVMRHASFNLSAQAIIGRSPQQGAPS